MTPFDDHMPGFNDVAAQTTSGWPPDTFTFLSFPCAKKAISRLSGDQNGALACSVPGMGWGVAASRACTHNLDPLEPNAMKASFLPSGEIGASPKSEKVIPSGAFTTNRVTGEFSAGRMK